jgi:hypothetical protein
MYCARGVVILTKAAFFCAASTPNFLTIAYSHIDNDSKISGFWCVAKARCLLTILEDSD